MADLRDALSPLREAEQIGRWAARSTSDAEVRGRVLFALSRTLETIAARTDDRAALADAVAAGDGSLRMARPTRRRSGDRAAVQFGGIRGLELFPPPVEVGLGHRERPMRCGGLTVGDPGALNVVLDRQVDHPAGGPGRLGQPAQRRAFVAAPEPEVEHDVGAETQGLQGNRNEPSFQDIRRYARR